MVTWTGASGTQYNYEVHDPSHSLPGGGGNYIFARLNQATNRWVAIYVGETGSFSNRLPNHNELPCVQRNGGTHVQIHGHGGGQTARKAEEQDIIQSNRPPCNG